MHPRHTPNVHIAFLVGHIDILVFYRFLHNLFSTIHLHIKHTLKYNKVVIPFKKWSSLLSLAKLYCTKGRASHYY